MVESERASIVYGPVPPTLWPWALAGFVGAGVISGSSVLPLTVVAQRLGAHPSIGVVVALHVLFPVLMIGAGVWYPRIRTSLAGIPLAAAGWTLSVLIRDEWRIWNWTPAMVGAAVSPFVVVGSVVSGALACGGAWVSNALGRRVGLPDADMRCRCGYVLEGTAWQRCPECGEEISETNPPARRGVL